MAKPKLVNAVPKDNFTVEAVFDQAMAQNVQFFNPVNWTIPGANVVAVLPGPNLARATLQLQFEMTLNKDYVLQVSPILVNLQNETMNPNNVSLAFIGYGIGPKVLLVTPTDPTHIDVTFDENIDPVSADITNISFVGDQLLESDILAVAGNVITITTKQVMLDAANYIIKIDSFADLFQNVMVPDALPFNGLGQKPKVVSATVIDKETIDIVFDKAMRNDASLVFPGNYTMIPVNNGGAQMFAKSIVVLDVDKVRVNTTQGTDGAQYFIAVDDVYGAGGNIIDPAANKAPYVALADPPKILYVLGTSINRANVIFSKPMTINPDILDHTRYQWGGELTTIAVISVMGAVVQLTTTDQTPGKQYNLQVLV